MSKVLAMISIMNNFNEAQADQMKKGAKKKR
jgi:hypothetical protein